ncbi:MAG: hypothetical protein ACRD2W_19555 [Acidimicrobiales bacterium]
MPGVSRVGTLAADLLIAMGKHFDALARERHLRRGWELASLWARAERLRHLIVCDAERLPAALVSRTAELAAGTGAHLWLVARGATQPTIAEGLGRASRCAPGELLGLLPVIDSVEVPSIDCDIALPVDNFLTFRAACKRLLDAEQFAVVDAVYLDAHQSTREWLRRRARGERLGSEQVATQLRAVTSSSLSSAETIVRLRAAQAAYFLDGALVEVVDIRRLGPVDVADIGLSRRAASKLRRLVTPAWACALALANVGGLGPIDLARLNIDAVSPDGRHLKVGAQEYEIPDYAAGLVRAQLLDRADAAGRKGDTLLTDANDGRFDPAVLGRRIDRAMTMAAILQADREPRAGWQTAPVRGHGVSIVALSADWKLALTV